MNRDLKIVFESLKCENCYRCVHNCPAQSLSIKNISEFHIAVGKLYLSPILDMHNGEILSYNISTSPNFKQTLIMLEESFEKEGNEDLKGLLFQSDQGWQYQMLGYHKELKEKNYSIDVKKGKLFR